MEDQDRIMKGKQLDNVTSSTDVLSNDRLALVSHQAFKATASAKPQVVQKTKQNSNTLWLDSLALRFIDLHFITLPQWDDWRSSTQIINVPITPHRSRYSTFTHIYRTSQHLQSLFRSLISHHPLVSHHTQIFDTTTKWLA